jgi:hypothetical protein
MTHIVITNSNCSIIFWSYGVLNLCSGGSSAAWTWEIAIFRLLQKQHCPIFTGRTAVGCAS